MGYTHYWTIKKPSTAKYREAVGYFKECLKQIPDDITLCNWEGTPNTAPEISDTRIAFNGTGELGHETCYIEPLDDQFNFCKTARKPYDLAVCVCLLCFKEVYDDDMKLSSDGDMDTECSWPQARKIVNSVI